MSNDLISRQDAIDAFEEQLDYLQKLDKNDNPTAEDKWYGVNWARNTIADLPPTQKRGEWILIDDTEKFIAKCSVCGRIEDSRMVKDYPFCHCGADMRKGGKKIIKFL